MLSRILWSIVLGSLIALVWVGYKRGAFEKPGDKMRTGMDRIKERLQIASNKARERLIKARNQASESLEKLGDSAKERARQAQSRVEHATEM